MISHRDVNSGCGIFGPRSLSQRIAAMYFQSSALDSLPWVEIANSNEEMQEKIFEMTVLNDCRYHPDGDYRLDFLKRIITYKESQGGYVQDKIMDLYTSLTLSKEQDNFRTYILPNVNLAVEKIVLMEDKDVLMSKGTTGLRTWNSALIIGEYLLCHGASLLYKKKVLELGAGTGFVGLLCASLYASEVTLTDLRGPVLERLEQNARLASLKNKSCRFYVKEIDWRCCPSEESLKDFDVVLASDVIFCRKVIKCLCDLLDLVLSVKEDNICLISVALRNKETVDMFKNELEARKIHSTEEYRDRMPRWFMPLYGANEEVAVLSLYKSFSPAKDTHL